MADLEGRRVLLVEDESLVAMLGEDMLLELGCMVDVAMRLDQGLALARTGDLDLAVLDVNLGKSCSYPIADLLTERGIPFIFATGYGSAGIEAPYRGIPVLQKPYQMRPMATLLMAVLAADRPAATVTDQSCGPTCTCGFGAGRTEPSRIRAD